MTAFREAFPIEISVAPQGLPLCDAVAITEALNSEERPKRFEGRFGRVKVRSGFVYAIVKTLLAG